MDESPDLCLGYSKNNHAEKSVFVWIADTFYGKIYIAHFGTTLNSFKNYVQMLPILKHMLKYMLSSKLYWMSPFYFFSDEE